MEIFKIYKEIGETPLEALERFRLSNPDYKESSLTYAGRLDPMAEGVLLILKDSTEDQKKEILNLPKQYYFEVIWGLRTDTLDVLGIPEDVGSVDLVEEKINQTVKKLENLKVMTYPVFSSKTVDGKPLWQWAREGRLSEIEIPKRKVEIFSIDKVDDLTINSKELLKIVENRINLVHGDFRQKEILKEWRSLLGKNPQDFKVSGFKALVGSGVYVRSISELMGNDLKIKSMCLKILREKVGDYEI